MCICTIVLVCLACSSIVFGQPNPLAGYDTSGSFVDPNQSTDPYSPNAPMAPHGPNAPMSQHDPNAPMSQHDPNAPMSQHDPNAPMLQHDPNAPMSQHDLNAPMPQHDPNAPMSQHDPNAPMFQHDPNAPMLQHDPNAPMPQHDLNAPMLQNPPMDTNQRPADSAMFYDSNQPPLDPALQVMNPSSVKSGPTNMGPDPTTNQVMSPGRAGASGPVDLISMASDMAAGTSGTDRSAAGQTGVFVGGTPPAGADIPVNMAARSLQTPTRQMQTGDRQRGAFMTGQFARQQGMRSGGPLERFLMMRKPKQQPKRNNFVPLLFMMMNGGGGEGILPVLLMMMIGGGNNMNPMMLPLLMQMMQ
ncbi:putative cuticle collagen 145 [Gigantopelta aegis]|uniref:putative cuticle collagen 145 n=1 Tax=Gigantopelta aegis TaxID=1735272 RepID=UPI001B88D61E|nr:putative cuticle collagen 145 [Gigantopelta aegis]